MLRCYQFSNQDLRIIALRSAEHLIGFIKQYHDSIEKPDELEITDPIELAQEGLKLLDQKTAINRSGTASIDKEDYLTAVIQGKIEIIALIGNFELLKLVYDELKLHEKYEPDYPLAEIFSILATGIGGWSS